jgi:membrane protease YdiL (CAAX protease family)
MALAAILALRRVRREGSGEGAPAPAGRSALAGVVAAFAIVPVLVGVQWLQERAYVALDREPKAQWLVDRAASGGTSTFLAVALFAVVAAPLFEEFVFRRLLYGGLRGRFGAALSMFLSAAIFAAWHMEPDALPVLFVLGLALAHLRERTGGLTAPIAMHACYNALQTVGILTARSGG